MKNLKSKKIFIILVASLVILSGVTFAGIKIAQKMNKITTCMVQFESSGGTKINFQEIEKGMQIIEPVPPTKEGFSFIEWQLNGEKFDFNSPITEDVILIAKWEANAETIICTVTFDSDGGSKIEPIEVAQGGTITPPINPVKQGYTLVGWFLNNEKYDFSTAINEDILLQAKWEEIKKQEKQEKQEKQKDTQTIEEKSNTNNVEEEIIGDYEYEKVDIDKEYGGETPVYLVPYKGTNTIRSFYGFTKYNTNTCKIAYRTDNKEIIDVSNDGTIYRQKNR